MEDIKPGMFFVAIDGDGIGKLVGRSVLANDVDKLHEVSRRIDAAQDFILDWVSNRDGIKISGGGDEAVIAIDQEYRDDLKSLRKQVEEKFGYTISVGVGRNLSEAGTALLVAKLRGKDRIVYFNKKIKEDIKKAKRRVREKRATPDEYKLSEAYLKKADPMLCNLHKSEKKNPGEYGNVEPHTGHKGMMDAGFDFHMKQSGIHRDHAEKAHVAGDHALGDKHRDMSEMHRAYTYALPAPGETEPRAPHHEMRARKQRLALTKSEDTSDLHKHEEGFHNGAANKEGKGFQNPDNEDNRTDDCNYCQDLDAEENADGTAGMHECDMCNDYDAKNGTTEGMDDCPACQEYDAKNGTTGGIEGCSACAEYDAKQNGGVDGCPYCENETIGEAEAGTPAEQGAEDHHECNCPNCPKKDETNLAVEDMGAEHPENCPQCQEMYSDAVENQPDQTGQTDPNLQGHETAEQVLDMLDQEPGSGKQTPQQASKQIDNTEMPQGDQMKEGTSVPEDFGEAQKGEISDSEREVAGHNCDCPDCPGSQEASMDPNQGPESGPEPVQDEPDMAGVLQNGLDEHADEQKRQQVLDMVGQTLAGFKANKASLEATKEQNQPLYNSCIQMLKSMIALCDLMGLKPQAAPAPQQAPNDPGAIAEATQSDAPAGPKQTAPGGAVQAPKAQGQE